MLPPRLRRQGWGPRATGLAAQPCRLVWLPQRWVRDPRGVFMRRWWTLQVSQPLPIMHVDCALTHRVVGCVP